MNIRINRSTSYLLAFAACAAGVSQGMAGIVLTDTFNSYSNGNLVGQGSWAQTGATTTNPIQVSGGNAVLGTAGGQDVYKALTSSQALATVGTLYFELDLKIASVNATGDYFFHVTPTAGDSSAFYARLFAKSSGAGFLLGLVDTSGTGSTFTFGSTVLGFSTDYKVVVAWTSVGSGTNNDTFKVYINPTNPSESSNASYLSHTWTSATAEPTSVAAVNLRQGANVNSPAVTIYDLTVATSFADIVSVPEPASFAAFAGAGVLGFCALRRRRRPV